SSMRVKARREEMTRMRTPRGGDTRYYQRLTLYYQRERCQEKCRKKAGRPLLPGKLVPVMPCVGAKRRWLAACDAPAQGPSATVVGPCGGAGLALAVQRHGRLIDVMARLIQIAGAGHVRLGVIENEVLARGQERRVDPH